jgi:hypothetical protein
MHSNADPSQVGLGGREIDRKVLTSRDELVVGASAAPLLIYRNKRPIIPAKKVFGMNNK